MEKSNSSRIEVQAVQALAEWKALFAEQVAVKAKELSQKSALQASSLLVTTVRLQPSPCRCWRPQFRAQIQAMAVKKQPDPKSATISEGANDWFRQFLKHLELSWSEIGQAIPSDATHADYALLHCRL